MISLSQNILPFICTYIIPLFIILYLNKERHSHSDLYSRREEFNHSSVWCKEGSLNSKLCKFKNICYDPKLLSFLFFLNEMSVIRGLSKYYEFQTIQLSTISLHNMFEANISVIRSDNYEIKNVVYIEKGLLFSRFKPDNIMHVFHDDLIPIFFTLEDICFGKMTFCEENYRLIIHDTYSEGPFFNLYKMFSSHEPVILNQPKDYVLCIEELHMGLIKDSIFYQYGFKQLQGPVNIKISQKDLSRFVTFVKGKLNIKTENNNDNIVLVSRKKSRKILNENAVTEMLERLCKVYNSHQNCKVIILDLTENKTHAFIKAVTRASLLVGMHGAEMIFSIFLPTNSTVIELFPYGIQSNIVSFVKVLQNMEGVNFHYINWTNVYRNYSVFHPDAGPLHGGINFLPEDVQQNIRNVKEVPAVECCNNPLYLYYMYQDTWIHSSFEEYLLEEMKKSNIEFTALENKWLFPSVVTNVTCSYDSFRGLLSVSWCEPFNIKPEALTYDVFVLEKYSDFKENVLTHNKKMELHIPPGNGRWKFQLWIAAVIKSSDVKSKDVFHECT